MNTHQRPDLMLYFILVNFPVHIEIGAILSPACIDGVVLTGLRKKAEKKKQVMQDRWHMNER